MKSKRPYGYPVPINPRYDFDAFIERVKFLDLHEIIMKASGACGSAERESYDRPGAVNARESGSVTFASRLKDLLFFLNTGALPNTNFSSDNQIYKEIAESLVAKGQLKKEVLDLFKAHN
jgi:hypothetical protein